MNLEETIGFLAIVSQDGCRVLDFGGDIARCASEHPSRGHIDERTGKGFGGSL